MSDSGAIPGPTVTTVPVLPRHARASRFGVSAASSGVRPSNAGIGSSPSPSRHTNSSFAAITIAGPPSSRLHDQREVLRIQARTADERSVDLGMRHEAADVARLDAAAVLDANRPADLGFTVLRAKGVADQLDDTAGVRRLRVPPGPDRPDRLVRDHGRAGLSRIDVVEGPADLLRHLRLRPAGVALLQRLADAH